MGGQSARIASPKSSTLHPECTPPETNHTSKSARRLQPVYEGLLQSEQSHFPWRRAILIRGSVVPFNPSQLSGMSKAVQQTINAAQNPRYLPSPRFISLLGSLGRSSRVATCHSSLPRHGMHPNRLCRFRYHTREHYYTNSLQTPPLCSYRH